MRYFTSIIGSGLFFLGIYAALAYQSLGVLNDDNAYLCRYIDKKVRLSLELPSPKLLIVSGSNAYAGISAERLEAGLSLPVFNFGINAGLGPSFVLHQAMKSLKPGDVVLLPLEYEMYIDQPPSKILLSTLAGCGKDYLDSQNLVDGIRLLLGQDFSTTAAQLYRVWFPNQHNKELQALDPVFGRRGDAVFNISSAITDAMRQRVEVEIVGIMFDEKNLNNGGPRALKLFLDWCKQHQITVLATMPNTYYREIYRSPDTRAALDRIMQWYDQQGIPFLGLPYDGMLGKEFMYDTSYHLNEKGVAVRTDRLLAELQKTLHRQ